MELIPGPSARGREWTRNRTSCKMNILISGICGFAGSTLACGLAASGHQVAGFDNFIRPGSERNRLRLKAAGIDVRHADLRSQSDIESLPGSEWLLDAAANPSVLAGVDGATSARQLVEHNLLGTINLLEFCKRHQAGFTLLSTSRVYAIGPLSGLAVEPRDGAFRPRDGRQLPPGLSAAGVDETFPTSAPVSLYGATKLASEVMALEYGAAFGFPVWINRCGVLAGAGQFGRPDQGIFSFWINSWLRRRPLEFIGFDGCGHQVRDCLHPRDLLPALEAQFGRREVGSQPANRPFDIPWLVLDSSLATSAWGWRPATATADILDEIAAHAEANPDWLDASRP